MHSFVGERYIFAPGSVLRAEWSPHANYEGETTGDQKLLQAADRRYVQAT